MLARQIGEDPPELALGADVKKPETGSGFLIWWRNTEPNPRPPSHADVKATRLRVLSSIKREFYQRALAALGDVLDLDEWRRLY